MPVRIQAMSFLQKAIGLRGYGQKDPLTEYKLLGYWQYLQMTDNVRRNVIYNVFQATFPSPHPPPFPLNYPHKHRHKGVIAFCPLIYDDSAFQCHPGTAIKMQSFPAHPIACEKLVQLFTKSWWHFF